LVAGVMAGVAEPELLIKGSQSPHEFSLRPSDMRALSAADLIVWVGPGLETALSGLLGKGHLRANVMTLAGDDDPDILPMREGADWESHGHTMPVAPADHATAHVDESDSHIWLSPRIARRIVQQVSDALARMDSANAGRYRDNAARLITRLQQLDERLRAQLEPVRERPYIVFHDAYHYFEQHYGLNAVGSVSISPERVPGARRVHELRQKILQLNARCVFTEPQFQPRLIGTLVEGTHAKIGQLDPLGSDLTPGPEAYFQLMQRLADNLVDCLK
ncbi:MAG: zinc ABC transporter substrate-binding protein, partial [Candidatus Thiodiazotropha sp.]